jgi:hypothetical protein
MRTRTIFSAAAVFLAWSCSSTPSPDPVQDQSQPPPIPESTMSTRSPITGLVYDLIRTPHGLQPVRQQATNPTNTAPIRPANLEILLKHQAKLDDIMAFLKSEVTSGDAKTLTQRAEARLGVKYNLVANKTAMEVRREDSVLSYVFSDATVDANGKYFAEGKVDVFQGGIVPGTQYETFLYIYSENLVPKYADLALVYPSRNNMPCLDGAGLRDYARSQGFDNAPGEGNSGYYGGATVAVLRKNKNAIMYMIDTSQYSLNEELPRYLNDAPFVLLSNSAQCSAKVVVRISY